MMFKFTREWFQENKNQVHTIQDVKRFNMKVEGREIITIGQHFLVDLYQVLGNGANRGLTDVEIWKVENTKEEIYHKRRNQKLPFKAIRKITTGKQFGYPNGYWKVPEELTKQKTSHND